MKDQIAESEQVSLALDETIKETTADNTQLERDENSVSMFVNKRCHLGAGYVIPKCPKIKFYLAYRQYCARIGTPPLLKKPFFKELERLYPGYINTNHRNNRGMQVVGIGLKGDDLMLYLSKPQVRWLKYIHAAIDDLEYKILKAKHDKNKVAELCVALNQCRNLYNDQIKKLKGVVYNF